MKKLKIIFNAMKVELSTNQKLSTEKLQAQLKVDRVLSLKEPVMRSNTSSIVQSKLEQSPTLFDRAEAAKALEVLLEGMADLKFKNKLVKFADFQDGGCATVNEYLSNDLAEDSDDGKIRAEFAAAKKLKGRRRGKWNGRGTYRSS